ncbi:hypothetical protein ALP97_200304 [Pseudomonas salomonii]|uniref:Uncharacterized protein n=2 Tax=Pseudomonas TaxID=286 RepID=A0A0W0H5C1_PSEFL|nr:hypothetical protein [Pseudomonas salomonii]KTB55961.1 hypothetical protein AO063_06160 [Pseudomonas fluorescens ICMP 11288]RMQ83476.1 hypothetical protein ALP97_200304 [Pseudomonas salomonii]
MAVEIFKEKWGADSEGSLTLKYLGIALAPLGDNYARRAEMGDVPVIADAGRTYTPDETIRLLQDYRLNLPSEYNNRSINEEYLIGKLDPVGSQHDFYRNNLYCRRKGTDLFNFSSSFLLK